MEYPLFIDENRSYTHSQGHSAPSDLQRVNALSLQSFENVSLFRLSKHEWVLTHVKISSSGPSQNVTS